MSLIRIRRRRKKNWIDIRRGKPTPKLAVFLGLVIFVIWYLGFRF